MTDFDESKYSRARDGKFSTQVAAAQEGALDGGPPAGAEEPESQETYWHASLRWARAGFTPDEANSWSNSGFTSQDAYRWKNSGMTLGRALAWRAAGFTPQEAEQWETACPGLGWEQTDEAAGRWKHSGVPPAEAAEWDRIGLAPVEAAEWKAIGVQAPGVAQAVIADFAEQDADQSVALIWHDRGFTGEQADRWWNAGGPDGQGTFSDPVEASAWRDAGLTPELAHAWHKNGMTTERLRDALNTEQTEGNSR